MSIGFFQILIILLLIILLFGDIPKILTNVAKGIKTFKTVVNESDKSKNKKENEIN